VVYIRLPTPLQIDTPGLNCEEIQEKKFGQKQRKRGGVAHRPRLNIFPQSLISKTIRGGVVKRAKACIAGGTGAQV